jgi:hypothetical protein
LGELEARGLQHPGGDPAAPAGRECELDPIAGELLTCLDCGRRLRLVRLQRERREDAVHLREFARRRKLIRTRGDRDAIHMAGSGDVAARDGNEAAAAARAGRWRSEIGPVEHDRELGAHLAGSEVAHVHVHLSGAADRLSGDLARIVIVRRKREARGVENRSTLSPDQDPSAPAQREVEDKAEAVDAVARGLPCVVVGRDTAAARESEHGNHEEYSPHACSTASRATRSASARAAWCCAFFPASNSDKRKVGKKSLRPRRSDRMGLAASLAETVDPAGPAARTSS